MIFTIKAKSSPFSVMTDAICVGEDGKDYVIDIFVDGSLPYQDIDGLIGRKFECDRLHTFLYIANDVKLLDKED